MPDSTRYQDIAGAVAVGTLGTIVGSTLAENHVFSALLGAPRRGAGYLIVQITKSCAGAMRLIGRMRSKRSPR